MSLGWLTESALIPKDAKPIEGVGKSSLLALQAAVYDREQRGPQPSLKRRRKAAEATKNEGVEARNAQDAREAASGEITLELSSRKLIEKAMKYEAITSGKLAPCKELLVDFAGKEGVQCELPEEEEVRPAFGGAAIPPPGCLRSASSSTLPVPDRSLDATDASAAPSMSEPHPALGIRQAFEKPLTSEEDRMHADRLHASTEHYRETVGEERRQARGAVRDRLAALRAKKLTSELQTLGELPVLE
jgi:hypothetical protein